MVLGCVRCPQSRSERPIGHNLRCVIGQRFERRVTKSPLRSFDVNYLNQIDDCGDQLTCMRGSRGPSASSTTSILYFSPTFNVNSSSVRQFSGVPTIVVRSRKLSSNTRHLTLFSSAGGKTKLIELHSPMFPWERAFRCAKMSSIHLGLSAASSGALAWWGTAAIGLG